MTTIFSKIIGGQIPCYKVAENDFCFAFLDINPLHLGHTLVVPKLAVDYIFELPNHDYQELMLFSKRVALAIERAIPCLRVGVAVIGLEVPHAHVHLVPLQHAHGLDFSLPKLVLSQDAFTRTATLISSHFI